MDRRRTFLAESSSQPSALASAIPVPSSAIKKQATLGGSTTQNPNRQSMNPNRMSLAGGPQRPQQQQAPPLPASGGAGGGAGRRSMAGYGMGREQPAPPSGNRGDGGMYGRTPRGGGNIGGGNNNLRRSSIHGGRPSMAVTPSGGGALFAPGGSKDTRPIKDRLFQQSCHSTILEYFLHQPRAPQIDLKAVQSPTQSQFQQMFKFLYTNAIDEDYQFGKGGKKFEEECIMLLKDLKYPAVDGLSRTAITAPGSHQWPVLLAMLTWMVDISQTQQNWTDCTIYEDYELMSAELVPLDAPNLYALFQWQHLVNSYSKWSDGAEAWPEDDQILSDNFERKFAAWYEEGDHLESVIQNIRGQLAQLAAQPDPLRALDEDHEKLDSDRSKFIGAIQYMGKKREKLTRINAEQVDEITRLQNDAATLRSDKAQVLSAIERQGLSPEEVQNMNSDRETLTRALEVARLQSSEATKKAYELEMSVSKRGDALESLVSEYMTIGYRLGLVPSSPDLSVDFNLELNLGGSTVTEVLGGDVSRVIRPALGRFAEAKRGEKARVEDQIIKLEDELDRKAQVVEGLEEEVLKQDKIVQARIEEAKATEKAAKQESAAFLDQQEHLEREIQSRTGVSRQVLIAAKAKVDTLIMERDQLVHRVDKLKKDTIAEIVRHTEFIIHIKDGATESLEKLHRFAEMN